jgi:hypothetical protein
MAPLRAPAALGASALLLAAATATVAAGCGGSSTKKPTGSAVSASTSVTPFSQAELEQRLLALSDMPPGYTVEPSSSSSSAGGGVSSSDPACQPLADLGAKGKPPESFASAETPQFDGSATGPFIDSDLASFATPAAAQAFLDKITAAIQGCKQFTETEADGTKIDISVSPFSFPAKGDSSSATRLGLSIAGQPVQADVVVARVGSTLVAVTNTGLQATDSALTESIIDKAIAKVKNPGTAPSSGASGSASTTAARAAGAADPAKA